MLSGGFLIDYQQVYHPSGASPLIYAMDRGQGNIAHSFRNHPFLLFQPPVGEARNLQKILTRHCVPFRAEFGRVLDILPYGYVNHEVWSLVDISRFRRFLRQITSKTRENVKKMPCFGAKTSDFLGTNLRTIDAKPPYFVAKKSDVFGFPAGKCRKKLQYSPLSRFCDIWSQGKSWWLPRPFSAR